MTAAAEPRARTLREEFGLRHLGVFLLVTAFIAFWLTVFHVHLQPDNPAGAGIRAMQSPLAATIASSLFHGLPVLVLVLLADGIHGHPRLKALALVLALLAGSAMGRPLLCLSLPEAMGGRCAPTTFGVLWNAFFFAMVLLGCYGHRRARRVRAALQEAEGAAVRSRRRRLEEELQGLQARVEPALLFETLERVRSAYSRGLAEGDRLLDALSAYLRRVLPEELGEGSTYERELDLLRAWIDLRGAAKGTSLERAAPEVCDARMPAMLLVPLARSLARDARPLEISARRDGDILRVVLSAPRRDGEPGARLEHERELRDRLARLYGDRARLHIEHRDAATVAATLEIPHERAESGDRGGRGEPARAAA